MRRALLLLTLLLAALPAYADGGIMSYTLLSGLIEYQGRILGGTIRWYFVNGVPAFREVLYISTAVHFLRLYLWKAKPGFDLPGETLKLALTMTFLYTFLFASAPDTRTLYTYTEGKQMQDDPAVQKQINSIDINASAPRPIALVNYTAWSYIDLFSASLIEEVSKTVNGTDPSRRMPLLLQRAVVNMQAQPILSSTTADYAAQFRDGCRLQYMANPAVAKSGLTFLDAMKETPAPGINNSRILSTLNPPRRSKLVDPNYQQQSCEAFRVALVESFRADLATAINKFSGKATSPQITGIPDDPYQRVLLHDDEATTLVNMLATQQLGSILNNDTAAAPGIYQQPLVPNGGAVEATVNPHANPLAQGLSQLSKFWTGNVTENPDWGNNKLTNELRHFYFRAPVLYGYAAVFFTLMAEFALVLSVVMGRFMFLWRAWCGMLALKCLPIIWIYAEGFLRGSLILSAAGRAASTAANTGLDSQLYAEIYTRTLAILEITGMVNDYSFLLLVPFIPGVGDAARRIIG